MRVGLLQLVGSEGLCSRRSSPVYRTPFRAVASATSRTPAGKPASRQRRRVNPPKGSRPVTEPQSGLPDALPSRRFSDEPDASGRTRVSAKAEGEPSQAITPSPGAAVRITGRIHERSHTRPTELYP